MDKYAALNEELCSLMGKTAGWIWDGNLCMVLSYEYQVDINWYASVLICQAYPCAVPAIEYLNEHPDKATALRYGIVRAVVLLLTRQREGILHERN